MSIAIFGKTSRSQGVARSQLQDEIKRQSVGLDHSGNTKLIFLLIFLRWVAI